MFRLKEYTDLPHRVAHLLPWAGLMRPGLVLTKTGELMASLQFRGPDLESAGKTEQVGVAMRLNNALKRLRGGWTVHTDAWRRETAYYPESTWASPVAGLVDAERQAQFQDVGKHFETLYYWTLIYKTPNEKGQKLLGWLWENMPENATNYAHIVQYVEETTAHMEHLLGDVFPWVTRLTESAFLSYLASTATLHPTTVACPEVPMYLDALLGTADLTPGIRPALGTGEQKQYVRLLTLRNVPMQTWPGLLSDLEDLPFPYRCTQRWIVLEQAAARKEIHKYERKWLAKRKGLGTILREEVMKVHSDMSDPDAEAKAADARAAQGLVASNEVAFGYHTATLCVWDQDPTIAAERLAQVQRVVEGTGCTAHDEDLNAVEALLGMVPGNVYANIRRPLMHSMNLAHLLPCNAVWAGPTENAHLKGPPLMVVAGAGHTPFRLSLHQGDVGDTLIIGPKGSGKSACLSMLTLQWQRYHNAQTFIFDKGGSARVATTCMGGVWYDLGSQQGLAFQPLASIDDLAERAWASEWMEGILSQEHVPITPQVKAAVWSALGSLATAPREQRTLTTLAGLVMHQDITAALQPYTLEGPYGVLLDGDHDSLTAGNWQCFETSALFNTPTAVAPTLFYLFHRLEQWLTGAPTIFVLDEASSYLEIPMFASRIKTWLQTLRKKNASVIFASQNLADVTESTIAATVGQECQTRIFLPNPSALEPQMTAYYTAFGLSPRQIEVIAYSTPKRHYYYQSPQGNRLFDLELGPVALALAGSGSLTDLAMIQNISTESPEDIPAEWLRAKGLPWAAEILQNRKDVA